jgi:hypothetical protein
VGCGNSLFWKSAQSFENKGPEESLFAFEEQENGMR